MQPVLSPHYSLIIPVHRNEESIAEPVASVQKPADALDHRLETIFVIDGSADRSLELLRATPRPPVPSVGIPDGGGYILVVAGAPVLDRRQAPVRSLRQARTCAGQERVAGL